MPAFSRGIIILALALQAFAAGNAVTQTAPPLHFESVSIGDGLSSIRVRDVLQDRQGFLWVATENGLNRYDGHR